MKKGILYSLAIAGTMMFASCGSETEEVTEKEPLEICFYTYDSLSTELTWTAYKTSAKVPVGGTFDDIQITSDGSSDDPTALLESMKFSIKTGSVNSASEERDPKIIQYFFGTINTTSIDGRLKKLKDNGKAIVEISMNGVKADVEGDYTFVDGKFTFDTSVEMKMWNAVAGIDALNAACDDLHTGDDGVSKLWSEVTLSFSTQFTSDCN